MDLSELQRQRNKWIKHNFPNDELVDSILGAVEEIGELAHHHLKHKQGIRSAGVDHRLEMLDAVADCVIYLAGVCTHLEADYGALVSITWSEVVEKRDWRVNRETGEVGHNPDDVSWDRRLG